MICAEPLFPCAAPGVCAAARKLCRASHSVHRARMKLSLSPLRQLHIGIILHCDCTYCCQRQHMVTFCLTCPCPMRTLPSSA